MPIRADSFREKICVVECFREQDGKIRIQMNKKTHTNPLSKREIEELRKNPNIISVSANTVRFTEEFKKQAYEAKARGISVAGSPVYRVPGIIHGWLLRLLRQKREESDSWDFALVKEAYEFRGYKKGA